MKTMSVGFIGGGRITRIFLQAFKNNQVATDKIVVYDTNPDALVLLSTKFPQVIITQEILEAATCQVVFLAIHPPVMMETLAKIKDGLGKYSLLVSLAPKITLDKIALALGGYTNIARMNPSASSLVNKGVNPVTFAPEVSDESKGQLMELVQSMGHTPEVVESKIEAYAVISAMGHTYFFFQLQKLKELAISFGMDEPEAQTTISNMLWGTTETLFKSGLTYEEVVDLVPVKPMGEVEESIKGFYEQYLTGIYTKIKP